MLIECPHCKSRVDAKVEGEVSHNGEPDDPSSFKVAVGKCPSCHNVLVGLQEELDRPEYGSIWSYADRLWPEPKRIIARSVPDIVKSSLEEADRCFSAGAYTACAVMCGRAIEGICVHHKTKAKTLNQGLKELLDSEIIDKRLFTWGDELRKMRNLGAHATGEKVPHQDAFDVLAFAHAITEYVFVLTEQFHEFMARRVETEKA
jgi:hypothetical protein